MSSFRRAKPSPAEQLAGEWQCSGCGQSHTSMFDLAAVAPDPWPNAKEREPNSAIRFDGNFLSEDFCVLGGKHFLIRGVLEVPVHGLAEKFALGCWSTLSRENFDKYLAGFDDGDYTDWGPWTGWLCNQFETYLGNEPEGVWVFPQGNRHRPRLRVANDGHRLAIDQEEGISVERLIEILRFYGHAPII